MDMSLGSLLGARPTSAFRPRFDAVGRWLLELAGPDAVAEACVFTNVVPGSTEVVRPWVEALRNVGFAVFAKPKIDRRQRRRRRHARPHRAAGRRRAGCAHVVVASGDGRAFRRAAGGARRNGRRRVTVIGFREYAELRADLRACIEFVDLEDIDGVFREPLPRITLDTLPDERRLAAAVPFAAVAAGAAAVTRRWSHAAHRAGRAALRRRPARCCATRVVDVDADGRIALRRARAAGAAGDRRRCARCPACCCPGLVNTHCHTPMTAAARARRRPAAAALAARGDVAGRGPADARRTCAPA